MRWHPSSSSRWSARCGTQHEAILDGIRRATPPYRPDRKFGYITWLYGLGLHGWVVDWCKQVERDLAEGRVPQGPEGSDSIAARSR